MINSIPEASVACVTRFLLQTCRVDQVGNIYKALCVALQAVDMTGAVTTAGFVVAVCLVCNMVVSRPTLAACSTR